MRAEPSRATRLPAISASRPRRVRRHPEAREGGPANPSAFGEHSAAAERPASRRPHENLPPGPAPERGPPPESLRPPGRAAGTPAGHPHYSQEGER
jgi:hypothetical protein